MGFNVTNLRFEIARIASLGFKFFDGSPEPCDFGFERSDSKAVRVDIAFRPFKAARPGKTLRPCGPSKALWAASGKQQGGAGCDPGAQDANADKDED